MALVVFHYEPVGLDVNEVCFEEKRDISKTHEKLRKNQNVIEWCKCGKWGVIHANGEYLSCGEVEALGYFPLSDIRYDDMVTGRVCTTVLQLNLNTCTNFRTRYRVPEI